MRKQKETLRNVRHTTVPQRGRCTRTPEQTCPKAFLENTSVQEHATGGTHLHAVGLPSPCGPVQRSALHLVQSFLVCPKLAQLGNNVGVAFVAGPMQRGTLGCSDSKLCQGLFSAKVKGRICLGHKEKQSTGMESCMQSLSVTILSGL
jgi:hypothetical protein